MSLCGAFVTLALNATLLGDQSLKVASAQEAPLTECSARNEASNPNAVLKLKDAKGNVVFSQTLRIADFDFYLTELQRGGLPAKDAIVFVNYPRTDETAKAKSVELSMTEFPYHQSTRLPLSIKGLK